MDGCPGNHTNSWVGTQMPMGSDGPERLSSPQNKPTPKQKTVFATYCSPFPAQSTWRLQSACQAVETESAALVWAGQGALYKPNPREELWHSSHLNHLGKSSTVSHLQQKTKGRLGCPSHPRPAPGLAQHCPPHQAEGTGCTVTQGTLLSFCFQNQSKAWWCLLGACGWRNPASWSTTKQSQAIF